MRRPLSNFAPIGRLHEPLPGLAARVRRAIGTKPRSIWADALGGVFLNNLNRLASTPPRALIGTYDKDTSVLMIELDLRLALRERAKQWITDWNTHQLGHSGDRAGSNCMQSRRGRPLRHRMAIRSAPLRSDMPQALASAASPVLS